MGIYKRIGNRVYYFRTAADLAAFLDSEKAKTNADQPAKQTRKRKKK
jgi:hypothetical protein